MKSCTQMIGGAPAAAPGEAEALLTFHKQLRVVCVVGGTNIKGDQSRMRGLLELVAEKAGWDQPTGAGVARGIAAHKSFGSYVAEVVETTRSADGLIGIDKVVCAVD